MSFFTKGMGKKEIVIVSGLPRSGTSLMMKMLHAVGYELLVDNLRTADRFNPNGYFEFEPVKSLKDGKTAWLDKARGKVVKVVSPLIQYLPPPYQYSVIFMERDMDEVLVSQSKMMDGLQKDYNADQNKLLEKAFNEHLVKVKKWLEQQSNFRVLYFNYNRLFTQTESSLMELSKFLGKSQAVEQMREIIDPGLYRNRQAQSKSAESMI